MAWIVGRAPMTIVVEIEDAIEDCWCVGCLRVAKQWYVQEQNV
jgi:hypothetical protein